MLNHENRMPPHISRMAFYSIPFFVVDSIVCYIYEYYRLSALLALLSVTSVAYWNSPKKMDLIKIADISVASLTIFTTTFVETYSFTPTNRYIFWFSSTIITTVFLSNEFWFTFSMIHLEDLIPKLRNLDEKQMLVRWISRTQISSLYIHMFFLHVLPNVTCIYCIINSKRI